MPRRRQRSGSRMRHAAVVCCCVAAPLGCVSLLLWAWVLVNFRDAPAYGDCFIKNLSTTQNGWKCAYIPGWWNQWEAHVPGIVLVPAPDEETTHNQSCTLVHTTSTSGACESYLREWNSSDANSTCWKVIERAWWFGPSHSNCYTEQPQGPDVFDRVLPLICGGVIVIVSVYFWVTCCLRRNHNRRRRRERGEQSALLPEEMGPGRPRHTEVTDVARIGRSDGRDAAATTSRLAGDRASAVVTVSAVWLGPTEAAVIMGDAKGGQYPCEVERIYDVSMSTEDCCVVCLTEPKHVVLWPCRHMCCCSDCAPRLRKCPLCRKHVTRRLRLELQPIPTDDAEKGAEDSEPESDEENNSGGPAPRSSYRSVRSNSRVISWRAVGVVAPLPPSPTASSSSSDSSHSSTPRHDVDRQRPPSHRNPLDRDELPSPRGPPS